MRANAQRLQDIENRLDLFHRIGRQRYAQRVADTFRITADLNRSPTDRPATRRPLLVIPVMQRCG